MLKNSPILQVFSLKFHFDVPSLLSHQDETFADKSIVSRETFMSVMCIQFDQLMKPITFDSTDLLPWFQRFIFIVFIAKGKGKINLWNQGTDLSEVIHETSK